MAARSKASVCGRSPDGTAGSNPAGGRGNECLTLVSVVCFQVEICLSDRSLIQRSPKEGVCV